MRTTYWEREGRGRGSMEGKEGRRMVVRDKGNGSGRPRWMWSETDKSRSGSVQGRFDQKLTGIRDSNWLVRSA